MLESDYVDSNPDLTTDYLCEFRKLNIIPTVYFSHLGIKIIYTS